MLDGPVMVFVEHRGYKHFAVLRGIRGDRVYLADPSLGNVRMPFYAFLDRWLQDDNKGIIFVVEPTSSLSRRTNALAPVNPVRGRPEIIAARELLKIGAPLLPLPHSAR
jgi:predicted double-glycine peptidase